MIYSAIFILPQVRRGEAKSLHFFSSKSLVMFLDTSYEIRYSQLDLTSIYVYELNSYFGSAWPSDLLENLSTAKPDE